MKLHKSILDRSFNYTPAAETDLKKTFARLKREAAAQKKADEPKLAAAPIWITFERHLREMIGDQTDGK